MIRCRACGKWAHKFVTAAVLLQYIPAQSISSRITARDLATGEAGARLGVRSSPCAPAAEGSARFSNCVRCHLYYSYLTVARGI
jgi:hypothetical protein